MLIMREMKPEDKSMIMPLVLKFYESDAVDHQVPAHILEKTFEDAVSSDPILRGITLLEEDRAVGFAYITCFYACEVGGKTIMLEELYLTEECRGKGYGSQFFQWVFREYPDVVRFRLEVTAANESASKLYERLGFQWLEYRQMILDRQVTP